MSSFLERLQHDAPLIALEMRPPRSDLDHGETIDAWMAMGSAARRLARTDTVLFFTDNAVGSSEEENLHHLVSNLDEVARHRVCPFLTTKHSLEYCLWYAARAAAEGHTALTVLGGDPHVGPSRCLPHAHLLRQRIRSRHPRLALGGWANPFRDPAAQIGYLLDPESSADFYLTQIVSHHDRSSVERFLERAAAARLGLPGVFGVFYYRSANPRTLEFLSRFLPVPRDELTRDFGERGLGPDQVCARTIRMLRELGVHRVYLSNLRPDDAPERLAAIRRLVEE